MHGIASDEAMGRILPLAEQLGLKDDLDNFAEDYSHGMKKKLALAAALLPGPDLLFLDEPFEGVDAVSSRVLRDVLPTVPRLIITFSKLDRLAFCPGLNVDLLSVAHRIVPPRHGVLVVTGNYVVKIGRAHV